MDREKILIVENDAIIAMQIENSLADLGYQVTSIANSGEKAIEQAKLEKPDLVLMDMRIEGKMNGIKTADMIRSRFDIPVVFSTTDLDEERINQAKLVMPFGYLLKPIQKRDLKVTIEMALYINKVDKKRKKAEEALQYSENRYRAVSELTSDYAYAYKVKPDGTLVNEWVTGAVFHLTGFSHKDLKSLGGWEGLMHPDDKHIAQDQLKALFMNQAKTVEYRIIIKNGQIRRMRDYARPRWDTIDKRITGIEGAVQDITTQIIAEEQIVETNKRLIAILDSVPADIYVSDMETHDVLYMNAQMIESFGKDLTGQICWKAFRGGSKPCSHCTNPYLLDAANKPTEVKIWEGHNPISNKYYLNHDKAIRWIDDRFVRIQISTEITGRKQVEEALRDSEEKYRNVVDNAIEAICVVQDDMFKYFNPEMVKLFGYTLDELEHLRSIETIYWKDQKKVISRRLQRDQGEHVPGTYAHRIITKDRRIRWVEIKAVSISWSGQPATLVFLTDVTERKQAERLMMQTEKMMSVGGLAAGMAHELNNPLAGILQGIQNVQRRLTPDLKSNLGPAREIGVDLDKLQQYMETRGIHSFFNGIQESGKKASEIILNMLQFSRKSESKMAPIDLSKLMENVLELAGKDYDLKKMFDFRKITIIKEFPSNMPRVRCTETEIEQVILNLLTNATWAMANWKRHDSPQITLRIALEDRTVRIEVEDNGPGMDEETRNRVFEPFYTPKPVGEGTGLGLSVSYMIITNNHKGSMEVESEIGSGSRFIIRLPFGYETL
ncbi:MAG: PAS domain S-box protein [Deltaproteobacteria bacterium]|nr:PAS domain S-box protein [Deltaproteobacteria bacterium]